MTGEFTYQDVAEHNTKNDCFVVIHDKVYDCTKFIDEHPGGEEVLLDVAGQDATEAFEDVGHSDEARETLDKLHVGALKRGANDPTPNVAGGATAAAAQTDAAGVGIVFYAVMLIGAGAAYFAYNYMQQQSEAGSA
ncbi:hypothetical protein MKZ38_003390 [Zalerion maritima]|uniref:Cytochrome b5 heme-binding domain-containing protein n=1 Tax=Zalerion maritima TaxID=339359 RepID=A0AAD5RUH9_9PEZI|nr:hypothetical protein MKZ38_003390 [Zalerion maritima]